MGVWSILELWGGPLREDLLVRTEESSRHADMGTRTDVKVSLRKLSCGHKFGHYQEGSFSWRYLGTERPPSTLRVGLAKNDTTSQPPYYFTTYFPHWLAYALHHRLREQP